MSDDGCDSERGKNNDGERTKVEDGGLERLDRYLDALADQRRRYVLYYLGDEEVATTSDIAEHIVSWDTGSTPSRVSDEEVRTVQTELQHNHLPRLADYGIIEYDTRTGDVRLEDLPQSFRLLLGLCQVIEGPFE